MMTREQMVSILSTMDDEHLTRAMSAAGIDCGHCGEGGGYRGEMGESADGADGLVSWNATDVKIPASKRPALFDKAAHVEQAQTQTRRMEMPPEETGMAEWSPPMGAMGY